MACFAVECSCPFVDPVTKERCAIKFHSLSELRRHYFIRHNESLQDMEAQHFSFQKTVANPEKVPWACSRVLGVACNCNNWICARFFVDIEPLVLLSLLNTSLIQFPYRFAGETYSKSATILLADAVN